jgi:hypothetical protein
LLEFWSSWWKGVTSEQTKNGMMGVVIHEVGHNFSYDCKFWWASMDLDGWRIESFMEYMAEQELELIFLLVVGQLKHCSFSGDQNS